MARVRVPARWFESSRVRDAALVFAQRRSTIVMATLTKTPEATSKARVLSAQEEAIHGGKKAVHGTATDRVVRIYDALRNSGPPRVTPDRAILFTESFKETEGQPLVLPWAKALRAEAASRPRAAGPRW
jgi:hypothetical protein